MLLFDRKPAREMLATQKLWIFDRRTNLHFTPKENTLKRSELVDFVNRCVGAPSSGPARAGPETGAPGGHGTSTPCPALPSVRGRSLPGRGGEGDGAHGVTRPASRRNRVKTARFKSFTCDELMKRDEVNRDRFWRREDALKESANLPAPEIIAPEITDDREAASVNSRRSRTI